MRERERDWVLLGLVWTIVKQIIKKQLSSLSILLPLFLFVWNRDTQKGKKNPSGNNNAFCYWDFQYWKKKLPGTNKHGIKERERG